MISRCPYRMGAPRSFFFFKQKTAYEIGLGIPAEPLFRSYNAEAVKILIFAAEGLTKRSAVGFLLRSLIMFQTFISRHNSNFFSYKRVLTSVPSASSAPFLLTLKATPSRTVCLLTSFPVRRAIMFMLVSWFCLTLPLLNAADWFR